MIYGLYLSANGLVTQGMRADVIANNLANTSTNGFKKDFLSLRQRDPEVLRQGGITRTTQRHLLAIGGAVEGDRSFSIFNQGTLVKTGNPLDVAIEGEGLFKYSDGEKTYYSRNGNFQVDPEGVLRGVNGLAVLSDDNEPIVVEENDYFIDGSGRVMVNNDAVAQIALVSLSDINALHKVGENMYENSGGANEVASTAILSPGHVEGSSVSAVKEMTALIEAQRAYQANAKMISIQDETLGKALTQIAI
jgi:flagellar basal-body rod protein FlgF